MKRFSYIVNVLWVWHRNRNQITCILYYYFYHQKSYLYVCILRACIIWKREYNIKIRKIKKSFIEDNTHEYVFDQLDRMQIIKRSLKEEHDKSSDIEQ